MALENIHQLALGVFSVDSRFVDGKNGIVIGKRAVLAIDGSNYQDEGAAMASFIRQNGFEPHRLVLALQTRDARNRHLGSGARRGPFWQRPSEGLDSLGSQLSGECARGRPRGVRRWHSRRGTQ